MTNSKPAASERIRLGLIGNPIAHSLSPAIFGALARLEGVRVTYDARKVEPSALGAALGNLRSHGYVGVNVTIPHKRAVLPLMASLTPEARAIGAVNAIRLSGMGLKGHNTDAAGFSDALALLGFSARGKDAAVFGAGGAARAVGYALGKAGAVSVNFTARRKESGRDLARSLEREWPGTKYTFGSARPAAVWVNATPLGMKGFPAHSPAPAAMVCGLAFDLVYGRKTPFLKAARTAKIKTCDGLGMLICQAVRGWEFWFGTLEEGRRRELQKLLLKKFSGES